MSGLRGDVTFDAANNARCQQAALMMAAERQVSHHPPPFWKGYTPAAAEASAHSDLCMNWTGDLGPGAIDIYMADDEAITPTWPPPLADVPEHRGHGRGDRPRRGPRAPRCERRLDQNTSTLHGPAPGFHDRASGPGGHAPRHGLASGGGSCPRR